MLQLTSEGTYFKDYLQNPLKTQDAGNDYSGQKNVLQCVRLPVLNQYKAAAKQRAVTP